MAVVIRTVSDSKDAQKDLLNLRQSVEGIQQSAEKVSKTFVTLASVITAGFAAQAVLTAFTRTTDAMTNMSNKLKVATKSQEELNYALRTTRAIAIATRTDLGATASLYSKISIASQSLGASQAQVAAVTATINKSLALSGATVDETRSVVLQMGQALASGKLAGDELRSVMEAAPNLVREIAAGLGTSIGQMRKLGEAGALTADKVFNAILLRKKGIDDAFSSMDVTYAGAFQNLKTAFTLLFASVKEQIFGTGGSFADTINGWAKSIAKFAATFRLQLLYMRLRMYIFVGDVSLLFSDMWQTITNGATNFYHGLIGIITKISPAMGAMLTSITSYAKKAASYVKKVYTDFVSNFKISGITNALKGLFKTVITSIRSALTSILSRIEPIDVTKYFPGMESIVNFVRAIVMRVESWFAWLYDKVIGHSWVPDLITGIIKWFKKLLGSPLSSVKEFAKKIDMSFANIAGLSTLAIGIPILLKYRSHIAMITTAVAGLTAAWFTFKALFTKDGKIDFDVDNIKDRFTKMFENLRKKARDIWTSGRKKMQEEAPGKSRVANVVIPIAAALTAALAFSLRKVFGAGAISTALVALLTAGFTTSMVKAFGAPALYGQFAKLALGLVEILRKGLDTILGGNAIFSPAALLRITAGGMLAFESGREALTKIAGNVLSMPARGQINRADTKDLADTRKQLARVEKSLNQKVFFPGEEDKLKASQQDLKDREKTLSSRTSEYRANARAARMNFVGGIGGLIGGVGGLQLGAKIAESMGNSPAWLKLGATLAAGFGGEAVGSFMAIGFAKVVEKFLAIIFAKIFYDKLLKPLAIWLSVNFLRGLGIVFVEGAATMSSGMVLALGGGAVLIGATIVAAFTWAISKWAKEAGKASARFQKETESMTSTERASAYGLYNNPWDMAGPGIYTFEKKAEGGYISGSGTGTSDSIPAMLSNGEFVVNAKASKRYGKLLNAINSGKSVKGFMGGGSVGTAGPGSVSYIRVKYDAPDSKFQAAIKDFVEAVKNNTKALTEDKTEAYGFKDLPKDIAKKYNIPQERSMESVAKTLVFVADKQLEAANMFLGLKLDEFTWDASKMYGRVTDKAQSIKFPPAVLKAMDTMIPKDLPGNLVQFDAAVRKGGALYGIVEKVGLWEQAMAAFDAADGLVDGVMAAGSILAKGAADVAATTIAPNIELPTSPDGKTPEEVAAEAKAEKEREARTLRYRFANDTDTTAVLRDAASAINRLGVAKNVTGASLKGIDTDTLDVVFKSLDAISGFAERAKGKDPNSRAQMELRSATKTFSNEILERLKEAKAANQLGPGIVLPADTWTQALEKINAAFSDLNVTAEDFAALSMENRLLLIGQAKLATDTRTELEKAASDQDSPTAGLLIRKGESTKNFAQNILSTIRTPFANLKTSLDKIGTNFDEASFNALSGSPEMFKLEATVRDLVAVNEALLRTGSGALTGTARASTQQQYQALTKVIDDLQALGSRRSQTKPDQVALQAGDAGVAFDKAAYNMMDNMTRTLYSDLIDAAIKSMQAAEASQDEGARAKFQKEAQKYIEDANKLNDKYSLEVKSRAEEAGDSLGSSMLEGFKDSLGNLMKTGKLSVKGIVDKFANGIIDSFVDGMVSRFVGEDFFKKIGAAVFGIFGGKSGRGDKGTLPGPYGSVGGVAGERPSGILAPTAAAMTAAGAATAANAPDYFQKFDSTNIDAMAESFKGIDGVLSEVTPDITASLGPTGIFSSIGDSFMSGLSGIFGKIDFSKILSSIGGFFGMAEGGKVSGPGTQTSDSIPAMLSNGEFVVSANAARRNIGLLTAINSGQVRRLAEGGEVTPIMMSPRTMDIAEYANNTPAQNNAQFNIDFTGDISRQTRSEMYKLVPQMADQINRYNRERGRA